MELIKILMQLIKILKYIFNHPLNKRRRISAFARFIKWQIVSRLASGEIIFNWVNDSKIIAKKGETGITGNIYCGLDEFMEMSFLLHLLRQEDLFVDVGANVGSYTVLACSAIGAKGFCVEPVPSTYSRLIPNIRLNDISDKVSPQNIALGKQKGTVLFTNNQNCMNHVIENGEKLENTVTVDISTLDDCLAGDPILIKIDVEGYELPVIEGAVRILKNNNLCAIIIEMNGSGDKYGYDETSILQLLFDYGFKSYIYNPFERKLSNIEVKNTSSGNTIFVRNVDRVRARLKSSQPFVVQGLSI
jgi:FkbM family methyltransferase